MTFSLPRPTPKSVVVSRRHSRTRDEGLVTSVSTRRLVAARPCRHGLVQPDRHLAMLDSNTSSVFTARPEILQVAQGLDDAVTTDTSAVVHKTSRLF